MCFSRPLSVLAAFSRRTWISRYQNVSILDLIAGLLRVMEVAVTAANGDGGGGDSWGDGGGGDS